METHSLWVDLILTPETVNREFLENTNENEIFDLIVYLIHNGINLSNSLNNGECETKTNLGLKFLTIKFLLFKIIAYLQWDLSKIQANLPTIHQEFLFLEFKKFCEKDTVPEEWAIYADILYHRWVVCFEWKSTYPEKYFKNYGKNNQNVNQAIFDPYSVPLEVQENLIKKIKNNRLHSKIELEEYIRQLEDGKIAQVHMPTFDCFKVANSSNVEFKYDSTYDLKIENNTILDVLYYDLACSSYIYEDYQNAHKLFTKIKNKSKFDYLDDYIAITHCMISKNYKMTEPKSNETAEKRLQKFLTSLVKENQDCVMNFDFDKPMDNKKMVQTFKKFIETCRTDQEMSLLKKLIKYLAFKLKGSNQKPSDLNSTRSLLLDIFQPGDSKPVIQCKELFEEGEIEEEDIVSLDDDDDDEFLLINATDPELILSLIPKIKRPPSSINYKWLAPRYEDIIVNYNALAPAELQRIHLILAKASELRNAKYYQQSRVLYLSLLEDIQASYPMLAEMIRIELLKTDIERVFDQTQANQSCPPIKDLKPKCVKFLRELTEQNYRYFPEVIETVCLFLIEYSDTLLAEFNNHPVDVVRLSACIVHLAKHPSHAQFNNEFWNLCLGLFLLPNNSKYHYPRIQFSVSFADFVTRIRKNHNVIGMISKSLIKLYNRCQEQTLQQVSVPSSKSDSALTALTSNLMENIDVQSITVTIDYILLAYLRVLGQDIRLLKYYAEFSMIENQYARAMRCYIQIIMYSTDYFTDWIQPDINEPISQLIVCANKMNHHVLAAILYQFKDNPDYGHAFKELSQTNYIDSSDDLYQHIWDVTLLEFLIHWHHKRGEFERKQRVIKLISQLDINCNNSAADLAEAAALRKGDLFRMLAKLYL